MKYLKLFESYEIDREEFPEYGYDLNSREKQILIDLVSDSEEFLKEFKIKKEDNYYYTYYNYDDNYYNKFDGFNELKDYILFRYYMSKNQKDKLFKLLKVTDFDYSFDDSFLIQWASEKGHIEIVKYLLKDPRVDPSAYRVIIIGTRILEWILVPIIITLFKWLVNMDIQKY